MIKKIAFAAALLAFPAAAQEEPQGAPSPNEIVAQADRSEWIPIAAQDLMVMQLAHDREGHDRQVVIQLEPSTVSRPWVANIRTLAKAHWWDGLAIVRVQDNYVVQWGDPEGEEKGKARPLPEGLLDTSSAAYTARIRTGATAGPRPPDVKVKDVYAAYAGFDGGFPYASSQGSRWPVHCYGSVGVGRGYSPDKGTGAELYAVIGHAPRHLDRNIAVVGRVIEGIEHLSTLPRGTGPLGFYETAEERVPIVSIRLASELPAAERPRFEYLDTDGATFARYADARANRRDPFFIVPAGGADVCNIPVPVRRVAGE